MLLDSDSRTHTERGEQTSTPTDHKRSTCPTCIRSSNTSRERPSPPGTNMPAPPPPPQETPSSEAATTVSPERHGVECCGTAELARSPACRRGRSEHAARPP